MISYDNWNEVKKKTSSNNRKLWIKPREIFWAKIGHNIGDEEYGKGDNFSRPVIVIKKLTNGLFLGVPTTTNIKNDDYFHKFSYISKQDGEIEVSAMVVQIRTFSTKRLMNKIGMINKEDFEKVVEKSKQLFGPT
jgi:mRNA interferase MazF